MYIISKDHKFGQTLVIVLCAFILAAFWGAFLLDKNTYSFLIFLILIGVVIYTNITNSKQFDIYIEKGNFIISNLYKRPIAVNAGLFNNVTAARLFSPLNNYKYSINFKDGSRYVFSRRNKTLKELFKSQYKIADELTQSISDYLISNPPSA